MNSASIITPFAIECGLRGLRDIAACVIEDGPRFHADEERWVITLSLRRDGEVPFIGASTRWCVLIDENYPFGEIAIYPAVEGGIKVTFPHQSRNTPSKERRKWRGGKLCLDLPLGSERRAPAVRDPVGDADVRLKWHVERAMAWLHLAANNQLLAAGDPFEIPVRSRTSARAWLRQRVVHDETAQTFYAWSGREGSFGRVDLGLVTDIGIAIGVGRFEDQTDVPVREWAGRKLGKCNDVTGFWWLWPRPIVLPPWQAPSTWGELRRVAKMMELDADGMLRWLLASIRGTRTSNLLLLGYPVSLRVGEPTTEVHWDALLLPPVRAAEGQPIGFRPNARGWWQRDRFGTFADKVALQYLHTENWSPERLQARGRFPVAIRDLRVALLGVGALGSTLAEMLVRAGIKNIALLDEDLLEAGNVCRHVATLVDVGNCKVQIVAQRLRQISPSVRVEELREELCGNATAIVTKFDEYDVIIDCTSSDEALELLATAWWSIPRVFASFSLGHRGKRVFSFGVSGHQFPQQEFATRVRPWLEHEARTWADSEEVLEGAGCWSPLFPARHDDVVLAAATCVKELETLIEQKPHEPRFRVFAQSTSDDGFQGLIPESAPPAVEASAS